MPQSRIQLRPHHLMCVHGFKGKGYSPAFVQNFWQVIEELAKDAAAIEVVEGVQDHVCRPCPNNQGTVCADQPKIKELDDAYVATLEIKVGDKLTWDAARKLVAQKVSDEDFDRNCAPCSWRKLGVCKEALQKLRNSTGASASKPLGASKLRSIAVMFAVASTLLSLTANTARAAVAELEETIETAPERAADKSLDKTAGKDLEKPLEKAPEKAADKIAEKPLEKLLEKPAEKNPERALEKSLERSGDKIKSTTVDLLESSILNDKSRRVPVLFKIQSALNARDWKQAIDAAKGLENNTEYADYYHYLLGQAELGRMHKFMHSGHQATAMAAAEQALFHLSRVQSSNPYTTLWRRANALVGEAEVTIGEILLRSKHRGKAVQFLENGFQRLSQVNQLAVVSKATIVSYAIICDKKQTDLCTSWVVKLAPLVARTEASRIFDRITAFKRPYLDRQVQQPYKVDLDLQAFQKGFASYQEAKYEVAFATWRDLLRDYPRTTIKLRTKFWMGRAAQRSQHDAQAETLFREVIKELPFSYYALLSGWFGNIEISRMLDAEMPQATAETPLLTPAEVVHIKRAETLIASAVPELAVLELQDVHASVNMPNEFLVYLTALNNLAGNHTAAFQMLGELSTRSFQGLFSSYGQKLYFPTTKLPLIRSLANEWKVDPLLVLSIVKQESAFNVEATSPANAYGLMQIIAPTARDLDPKIEIMDLFNAGTNVKLGSKYVRQLLNRYKGSIIPALCAYNAGPGNSDRWMRETRLGLPPEEYIELIGYRETREYVQNILRNYYWYTRRIKGESFSNLSALSMFRR